MLTTKLFATPAEAHTRLMELGVSVEALQAAVAAGHAGRILATENDAPFIPGTFGWSYTVRALRDALVPLGWRKADPGNFSLVINDKRKINIIVESGDAATRMRHLSPKTKSLKGLYVEAAALRNRFETDLFPDTLSEDLRRVAAILEHPTWMLLVYITDDEYRAELSLPGMYEDRQIVGWDERIFIPDSDDPLGGVAVTPDFDAGPDIDIPVRRKA
ncbi:MAG: hypothetical protein ACT6RD_14375 [Brevundimonas sp.]|uniref:hypothetical protein n=1 Tax=Brevundimonas sp. TaxID=1871086 RepID=UPI004034A465